MTPSEYIRNALRTESGRSFKINDRLAHGIIGISTEGGEMLGALKKSMFYGNQLDIANLKEEMGDVLWYIALLCDELGVSIELLMKQNIGKLRARYPDKFSKEDSDHRDYDKEAKAMEGFEAAFDPRKLDEP